MECVGRGGFASVYRAYDRRLDRDVAIKVPHAGILTSPALRERFLREARLSASFDHAHIMPVFESGEAGVVLYIASHYCDGPTLGRWIRERTAPVDAKAAARLTAKLADGVAHAHGRGVLHRDLKPSNILLERIDGESWDDLDRLTPRIADFGLAKVVDEGAGQTVTGESIGTPSYMAPEQAEGRNRDFTQATDVYGLGAVLYELLTGLSPFVGESARETRILVSEKEPVPPRALRPKLAHDLNTICLKCLEKDPRRRYATATALAEDLRRFVEGASTLARPVGPVVRSWRWCRRKPRTALLVASLVTAIVAGTIGVGVQSWRANRQRAVAEAEAARARRNLDQAMSAVDSLLTRVGATQLHEIPRMTALRRDLLAQALVFYRGFLHLDPIDPKIRLGTARAYNLLAGVDGAMGDRKSAEAEYRQGIALLESLVSNHGAAIGGPSPLQQSAAGFPRQRDLEVELCHVLIQLGDLKRHALGHLKGDREYARAAAVVDRWPDAAGEVASIKLRALLCMALGRRRLETGDEDGGEAFIHQAIKLRRAVLDRVPEDLRTHISLAASFGALATSKRHGGHEAEAADLHGSAIAIHEALIAQHPNLPEVRSSLGLGYRNQAIALRKLKEVERARANYQKALGHFERLVQEYPRIPYYRGELGQIWLGLSMLELEASRHEDAVAPMLQAIGHAKQARDLDPSSQNLRYVLRNTIGSYSGLLVNLGRHAEASRVIEEFGALADQKYDFQHAFSELSACIDLARSDPALSDVERERAERGYAEIAVRIFRRPERPSYWTPASPAENPAVATLMRTEPFQRLLAEVGVKSSLSAAP